jgi:hypothetical protein
MLGVTCGHVRSQVSASIGKMFDRSWSPRELHRHPAAFCGDVVVLVRVKTWNEMKK